MTSTKVQNIKLMAGTFTIPYRLGRDDDRSLAVIGLYFVTCEFILFTFLILK